MAHHNGCTLCMRTCFSRRLRRRVGFIVVAVCPSNRDLCFLPRLVQVNLLARSLTASCRLFLRRVLRVVWRRETGERQGSHNIVTAAAHLLRLLGHLQGRKSVVAFEVHRVRHDAAMQHRIKWTVAHHCLSVRRPRQPSHVCTADDLLRPATAAANNDPPRCRAVKRSARRARAIAYRQVTRNRQAHLRNALQPPIARDIIDIESLGRGLCRLMLTRGAAARARVAETAVDTSGETPFEAPECRVQVPHVRQAFNWYNRRGKGLTRGTPEA